MNEDTPLDFDWDPDKSARNEADRGIAFQSARAFDFRSALLRPDDRRDYGERRISAIGFIDDRLHVLIFTERRKTIRVISLRKANQREIKTYARAFEI